MSDSDFNVNFGATSGDDHTSQPVNTPANTPDKSGESSGSMLLQPQVPSQPQEQPQVQPQVPPQPVSGQPQPQGQPNTPTPPLRPSAPSVSPGNQPSAPSVPPQGPPPEKPTAPMGFGGSGETPPEGGGLPTFLIVASVLVFALLIGGLFILSLGAGGENPVLKALGLQDVGIRDIIAGIVNIVFIFAGVISFIALLIGAYLYAISIRDPARAGKAKKVLIYSLVCLVTIIISGSFVYSILHRVPTSQLNAIKTIPEPPQGPAPLEVIFDISAIANPQGFYEWDFGDGGLGTGIGATHTYSKEGLYTVTLKETLPGAEPTEETVTVNVSGLKPETVIRSDVQQGDYPLTINFDGGESKAVEGRIISWEWDFGDEKSKENKAKGKSATHVYAHPGSYVVTLTTQDTSQNVGTNTLAITVEEGIGRPRAVFVTSPQLLEGNPPFRVRFNASASFDDDGHITKWEWDFGDGTPVVRGEKIEHTYKKSGVFNAKLMVTDNAGNKVSKSAEVYVGQQRKAPKARITMESGSSGAVPFVASLDASKSDDRDGSVVSWEWDFGDGTPVVAGEKAKHTYTRPGTYKVTLTVYDNDGVEGKTTKSIRAGTQKATKPVPVLNADPVTGTVPLAVTFDASTSYDTTGQIISYEWDFGDGAPIVQAGAKITHVYEQVGIFPVTLVIHDTMGQKAKDNISIAVNRLRATARFDASKISGKAPLTVRLDANASTGNIMRYEWDFGDGGFGRGSKISHVFKKKGDYEVALTIYDDANVTDTYRTTISVK